MEQLPLIEHGGVVMLVLGGLSVYVLTIILYKSWQFLSLNARSVAFIDPVLAALRYGQLAEARKRLQPVKGPIARVMRVAIECTRSRLSRPQKEAEVARVGAQELRYLESHLRGLEMVGVTAPLLGLLGTVIGMVAAFSQLSAAGTRVDPSMLADGIWAALLTTVAGLIVAIPAIAAHYILDSYVERMRARMQDVAVQIFSITEAVVRRQQAAPEMQELPDSAYQPEPEPIEESMPAKAAQQIAEAPQAATTLSAQQQELLAREQALRSQIAEQERRLQAMQQAAESASYYRQDEPTQTTDTLRMLNPVYASKL